MQDYCHKCKQEINFGTPCCYKIKTCAACWGSHGCSLPINHNDDHECRQNIYDNDDNIIGFDICSKPTAEFYYKLDDIFDFRGTVGWKK